MMNWGTGWSSGGGWLAMSLMMLFWVALIGLAIWAAVRLLAAGTRTPPAATPRATLDSRLASGAIDAEEYARLRRLLEGTAPGTVVGDTPPRP